GRRAAVDLGLVAEEDQLALGVEVVLLGGAVRIDRLGERGAQAAPALAVLDPGGGRRDLHAGIGENVRPDQGEPRRVRAEVRALGDAPLALEGVAVEARARVL